MFEDSLMESGGRIKTKSKYWSILTLCLNGIILAALIIWPLLHPEALPPHTDDGHAAGCPIPPTAPSPATTTSGACTGQDQV